MGNSVWLSEHVASTDVCVWMCVFQVLHSMVSSVERPPAISAGCQLILRCKDFRIFQILIPQERDCADIHASLLRLSRPGMLINNYLKMFFKCVSGLFWHGNLNSYG